MRAKIIILIAAVSGILVVGLGAIGSHALEDLLIANNRVETFQTAIRYHSFHTVALLCLGILERLINSRRLVYGTCAMLIGMILFSGSLYLLSIFNHIYFAYITPFGGVLLILSWLILFFAVYQGEWIVRNRE